MLLLSTLLLMLLAVAAESPPRPPDDPLVSPRLRRLKTEAIKARILSEVRMPTPPPGEQWPQLPRSILDLVERREPERSAIAEGENLVSYPLAGGNATCVNQTSGRCVRFEFDLPSDSRPVSSIHLWVRKFIPSEIVTVSACLLLPPEQQQQDEWCEHEETLNKIRSEAGWEIFELSPKYVFELRMELPRCALHILGSSVQDYGDQKPFLVSNLGVGRAPEERRRRSAAGRNCTCCLINFYVSFKEIGWHWVVAPLGFSANMCFGTCSSQLNAYPSHYHRMLSTVLASNKTEGGRRGDAAPWTPCCSPTKLSPLDMIYVAGNATSSNSTSSFIYHKIPDMITESCGCW